MFLVIICIDEKNSTSKSNKVWSRGEKKDLVDPKLLLFGFLNIPYIL